VNRLGPAKLSLDPRLEFGRRELLGRLRRAVMEDAHHDNRVGVDVQTQLDGLMLPARGLLRANFGDTTVLSDHNVGGCSGFPLACQLLMSSPITLYCLSIVSRLLWAQSPQFRQSPVAPRAIKDRWLLGNLVRSDNSDRCIAVSMRRKD
jgi:hypothetical protein